MIQLLIIIGVIQAVLSYPGRPGSCRTGNPMGGSHVTDMYGSLKFAGFQVFYQNSTELVSGSKFNTSRFHEFDLRVSNWDYFEYFRGVLIRLSAKNETIDASNVLEKPYAETQLSKLPSRGEQDGLESSCDEKVSALGHNNRNKKETVTFDMYFDDPGSYLLEVTVVFQNSGRSKDGYYKGNFDIEAI